MDDDGSPVVLIDGVCNLCSGVVRFVVDRERSPVLRFASLQSDYGRTQLRRFGLRDDRLETFVLIEDGRALHRSDAALRIAATLRPPWSWGRFLRVVPRFLREGTYNLIARNRYRWFGRQETCILPRPDLASRFLDETVEGFTPPPNLG